VYAEEAWPGVYADEATPGIFEPSFFDETKTLAFHASMLPFRNAKLIPTTHETRLWDMYAKHIIAAGGGSSFTMSSLVVW
jgi:hypothetical protein